MSKISKLKKSRANWKGKSIDRGSENRKLKKELKRMRRERDRLKQENKELKAQLDNQTKPYGNIRPYSDHPSIVCLWSYQLSSNGASH